ncbi:helix-turn-helix domain-containing protein [Spongiimicrobium salis]|uniref:helix-turn-helix domain-containing protein n=1 Tax=Spongiimicrobium salis TaxID=1667022 RepID=UPI00374CB017
MKNINQKILAEKIKEARLNKALSQESLAEISHISLRTIQRIEKENVVPRLYTLQTLAKVLDLKLTDFASDATERAQMPREKRILNKMNLFILLTLVIPLGNILLPFALWKRNQKSEIVKRLGGKIISFQILWTIFSMMLFFLSIALNNLFSGDAGNALYVAMIVYVFCLIFNLIMVSKNTLQLNQGDKNTLAFVPNFF